jgi:2,5-dioxopentanoate dehydrogenase
VRERGVAFAEGLKQSVTQGVGQFCTCPGLVLGIDGADFAQLRDRIVELIAGTPPATMLHPGILKGYEQRLAELGQIPRVKLARSRAAADQAKTEAAAALLSTDAATFLARPTLGEEVFGPATVLVGCASPRELEDIAAGLHGHLTATIHGTTEDLVEFQPLVSVLASKVGRLIFNGFPTGVEVCPSMVHGGPYPATTDARSTSVGPAAIKRFARPVCYQNFPPTALPAELQDENPRHIWRLIDGQWSR